MTNVWWRNIDHNEDDDDEDVHMNIDDGNDIDDDATGSKNGSIISISSNTR